jgi:DNA-binding transcriptional MerR regulator
MYKIGEFSRITNLTVKALRYYDDENILNPSYRDEANGYRLYDENDFKKAELILLLRKLAFSISEIKDVLENYESHDDLAYYLTEKKVQLSKKIKDYQNIIRTLEAYISKEESEDIKMNYEVVHKDYDSVLVAAVRFKGKYEDTGKYFGKIFGLAKSKVNGTPFCCYYDGEYKDDDADIEVCVPVKEPITGDGVATKRLPGIKAICTTHIGPYDTLTSAYKALSDYSKKESLICKVPSREIYIKGPGMLFKGNANKYVTEIVFEVE